jgi:hypothetical protein
MPTQAFTKQKQVGVGFEALVDPVLREKGFEIVDTDSWSYRRKQGVDRVVKINGQQCNLEMKFDKMSEATGNVALELKAIGHSISPIWIYGFPQASEIDLYTMFLKDLKQYAFQYYKTRPGAIKRAGEYGDWILLVPKCEFIIQPFVKNFKTIKNNQV